jgi:hypothetical protein
MQNLLKLDQNININNKTNSKSLNLILKKKFPKILYKNIKY